MQLNRYDVRACAARLVALYDSRAVTPDRFHQIADMLYLEVRVLTPRVVRFAFVTDPDDSFVVERDHRADA